MMSGRSAGGEVGRVYAEAQERAVRLYLRLRERVLGEMGAMPQGNGVDGEDRGADA